MNTNLATTTPVIGFPVAVQKLQNSHNLTLLQLNAVYALVQKHGAKTSAIMLLHSQGFTFTEIGEIYGARERIQEELCGSGTVSLKHIANFCQSFSDEPIDAQVLAARAIRIHEMLKPKLINLGLIRLYEARLQNPGALFESLLDFVSGEDAFSAFSDDDPADDRFEFAEGG